MCLVVLSVIFLKDLMISVFNKRRQSEKFTGYCLWTRRLGFLGNYPNFMNNMRNIGTEYEPWISKVFGGEFCFPVHVKGGD